MRSYLSGRRINIYEFLKLSRACDIVQNNTAKISLFVMFSICFLFLVSPFYVYFFIFCGLTHHPPPVTRYPPTRYPPPVTRHPSPAEKSCRSSYRESNKGSKERQGPTLGVHFILDLTIKRELTVFRVQRKSVLQPAIRASCSQHELAHKSFQLAPKPFLVSRIDYNPVI